MDKFFWKHGNFRAIYGAFFGLSLAASWLILYGKSLFSGRLPSIDLVFLFSILILWVCWVGQAFIGYISDSMMSRLGRRKPFLVTPLLIAALAFGITRLKSPALPWMIGMFVLAFCTLLTIFRTFLIERLPPHEQKKGLIFFAFLMGGAFAFILSGKAISHYFRLLSATTDYFNLGFYWFDVGFIGLSVSWILLSIREEYPPYEPIEALLEPLPKFSLTLKWGWCSLIHHVLSVSPNVRRLHIVQACAWLGMTGMILFLPLFVRLLMEQTGYQANTGWIDIYLGLFVLFGLGFLGSLPLLLKRLSAQVILVGALTLGGLSLISVDLVGAPWQLMWVFIGGGIVFFGLQSLPYIVLLPEIPKERIGTYLGVLDLFTLAPIILMVFIAWLIWPWQGSNCVKLLMISGVSMLFAAFWLRRP
jgi:maltose/moltooligosaccharide transporter